MTDPAHECLCAGIVVADHVCAPVDHVPAPGELVVTRRMDLTLGGCASNVAVDLARLGAGTAIAGVVGRDAFGEFARETLQAAGVDCTRLRESETAETSGTLVINTVGEDRRFIHSIGANAEFTAADVDRSAIASAKVLYLGGYLLCEELSPDQVAGMFRDARNAGVTTVLDVVVPGPGDYRARLEPVLPLTDVFLPNEDEGRVITGESDPWTQAERFREAGAGTVVVTCGAEGAVLASDEHRLRAGTFSVEFVDGTGSGDAFAAGYIYGLLRGFDVADCLRSGAALGASCVRAAGATTGVFTADELRDFLAEHELAVDAT